MSGTSSNHAMRGNDLDMVAGIATGAATQNYRVCKGNERDPVAGAIAGFRPGRAMNTLKVDASPEVAAIGSYPPCLCELPTTARWCRFSIAG